MTQTNPTTAVRGEREGESAPQADGLSSAAQIEPVPVSPVPASIPSALWPTFEFRPRESELRGSVFRYADGQWLPDDGEHDLAFIMYGASAPMAMYVDLPNHKNIIWSGLTTHWSASVRQHPHGNPWHYMLRDGESQWGGDWGRSAHPNARAGNAAMNECASRNRCANGRGVRFEVASPHIVLGLVRDRATKEIVSVPPMFECMYCGSVWRDALIAQVIEARRAETQSGSVHESAVATPCAQTPEAS